jgi:type II secretory pathway pseudopilin PulG
MKLFPQLRSADAKEMRRQGERAFTMVEIALAIGVIGFALVAIIGILPSGMNVQKDNREDTIISQDAPYFLDAIRNGAPVVNGNLSYFGQVAQGLDFLTNYVQQITVNYYSNGAIYYSTNFPNPSFPTMTGAEIIGLLSTPQNSYGLPSFESNYFVTSATIRALSGPATSQQNGTNSGLSSFMAFTYKMEVFVSPFNNFAPDTTNWAIYPQGSSDCIIRSNRWLAANPGAGATVVIPPSPYLATGVGALQYNLFDVRLRFSWPVLANGTNGNVGPGRQTYRTLVSSQMAYAQANYVGGWFFQPQSFANVYPNGL